jgi:hypothetical protein
MNFDATTVRHRLGYFALACLAFATGCFGDSEICEPGETQSCTCQDGKSGAQECNYDGESWGACVCSSGCTGSLCNCGNGVCGVSESCSSCPADCGTCSCGDGVCGASENCHSCSVDCGTCICGDGDCEDGETCDSCPVDCGSCNTGGECGPDNFTTDCGGGRFCPADSTCLPNDACGCNSGFTAEECNGTPCNGSNCIAPNWWCNPNSSGPVCGDGVCDTGENCSQDCQSFPDTKVLGVPAIPQLTQVWCWAASSEMVLTYFNKPAPQCSIVSYWTNLPCCPYGNGVQGCYIGAPSIAMIANAIQVGGVGALQTGAPLTFAQVKEAIATNHPVVMGYSGSFSGHVVVLHGYDAAGNIYINDPLYGSFVVPYATSGLYSGAALWTDSIITGF